MKHYLVYGNRVNGYSDRYEVYADCKKDAEEEVIRFGYDSAEAFDYETMLRCELQLFGNR